MLPYFELPTYHLGPLTLAAFGPLVAIGVLVGGRIAAKAAAADGVSPAALGDFVFWALIGGLVGGHLFHLFLYHPEELRADPWKLLRVWDGLSSTGGLLGGLLTGRWFLHRKGLAFRPFEDALALGTAPGWAIARLGCFAVHDHPGVRSDFFLAVAFPGGGRHDLGLYDALLLGGAALLLWGLRRSGLARGQLLPILAAIYGVGRFLLDFLRARDLDYVDARYFGLTPAQYVCVGLVAWGAWRIARAGRVPAPAAS